MIFPGVYRHKKGGLYYVIGEATVSTNGPQNGSKVVIYQSLDGTELYVRDKEEFDEPGRFEYLVGKYPTGSSP